MGSAVGEGLLFLVFGAICVYPLEESSYDR
jgi:hypothetical protein